MKVNLLASVSGVSFLCLFTGWIPVLARPAIGTSADNTQTIKFSEKEANFKNQASYKTSSENYKSAELVLPPSSDSSQTTSEFSRPSVGTNLLAQG